MSDSRAQIALETRILTTGLNNVLEDLRQEIKTIKSRNNTLEEMQRFLTAWLGMRWRNHMVALERTSWGMAIRFTVENNKISLTPRDDSEIKAVVDANQAIVNDKLTTMFNIIQARN